MIVSAHRVHVMKNSILLESLWDETVAKPLDQPNLLLYRSNLLGADLRITNFGGGNTSAKVQSVDPLTGKDTNSGLTRALAKKTVTSIWNSIPKIR